MPIVPDDKNWTWVLEQACPECGFDGGLVHAGDVSEMIRRNAAMWPALLGRADSGTRPRDDQWSALEYGCHVRDVFRLYDLRLHLMLDHDGPTFPNWDQDVTAVEDRYDLQNAETVVSEIGAAAETLAASFAAVEGATWERTGLRSDGAAFTIDSFARYLIHDPIHHVHDVEAGFTRLGSA